MLKKFILSKLNSYTSKWLVLIIDIVLILLSYVFACFIRFDASFDFSFSALWGQLVFLFFISLFSFLAVGSYKGVIRHTGLRDAFNVFIATFIMSTFLLFTILIMRVTDAKSPYKVSVSLVMIHYLVSTFVLIFLRFVFKALYEYISTDVEKTKNVLIYGAGDAGLITYGALQKDKKASYRIVGFIDDDKNKISKKINRVKILSLKEVTSEFIERYNLQEVIISIQKITSNQLLIITDSLIEKGLDVKIVPPLDKWVAGDLEVGEIKQIRIEDLLDRAPIKIKNPIVQREVNGKKILISGAAGSIGSEITRQLSNYKYKQLILVDQAESPLYDLQQELKQLGRNKIITIVAGVHDKDRMEGVFREYQPDSVFHAAAYKHVPLMEENPYEAIKTNVLGTKNMVDLSVAYKAKSFVMVSTDKAVNPTNIMGATKRIAEIYVGSMSLQQETTKFTTTRFGNVLGSNGSVIPLFKKQIAEKRDLTVTHKDITRYFMTIPEACNLVLEAGTMGKGGEIYIFDMGKAVKIFDIAKKMIRLSGLRYPEDININIVGLRPGEKLFEELLANGENTKPTYHEKIMIAKTKKISGNELKEAIETLCVKNCSNDTLKSVLLMKQIVPEFLSNNSVYEKLDEKVLLD